MRNTYPQLFNFDGDNQPMLQDRSVTSPLFRTSLRDWQANFKAQKASQPSTPAPVLDGQPVRVKRLAARKLKKLRTASLQSGK